MSLLTELCPFVDDEATNMPALTGLGKSVFHLCFICGLKFKRLCPVRPPQTAIGRPAGTLLGSAPVPVAVSGVAPAFVPTGQPDNSPAFQRRVIAGTGQSPTGTAERMAFGFRNCQ